MKLAAAITGALVASLTSVDAAADDCLVPASLGAVAHSTVARPIGRWSAGGRVAGSPMGGPLLGVEGAWATALAVADDPSHASWSFGARAGWAFSNGVAVHVRYDDLGVEPASAPGPLQLATAGLRYSLPFVVPLPFAEVDAGPAFVGGDVHFGAGAALGASLPLGPHVLVDLLAHDWLVPIAGELRQTLTVGLGLAVTFASPAH